MADTELLKKIYRILSWTSLAALILVLVLVLRKSPPPPVADDPGAGARAEQKFAAADKAKAAGQPAAVALDPSELNSYLKQNLQLEGGAGSNPANAAPAANDASAAAGLPAQSAPAADAADSSGDPLAGVQGADQATLDQVQSSVKDVKVDMVGDLVKAYVIFDFHGKDLSLELDGHLSSDGGYIKFDPVGGKLGPLPLPLSTLQAAVDKMMNSPENRDKLKLPPNVSDIQVQNGQAMVTYK
ncbi:MAG: hypothetical protein ACRD5R_00165 [Candidatus Acidiferrales bacterium]